MKQAIQERGAQPPTPIPKLNAAQCALVEQHMEVVHWVIVKKLRTDETRCGYGYEDLYQEGCICLCQAALWYDSTKAQFETYAKKVVYNGLISYCRRLNGHAGQESPGETALDEQCEHDDLATADDFTQTTSRWETLALLESRKVRCRGVAKLGIEALELQITGYSVTDIAKLYRVPVPHVGAWISRSKQKLRQDTAFLKSIR